MDLSLGATSHRGQGCLGLDSDFPTGWLVLCPERETRWRGMAVGSYEKGNPKPPLLSGLDLRDVPRGEGSK